MLDLQNHIYNDEEKAREHLESVRWPDGAICPHCGTVGNSAKLQGKSTRKGVYKCRDCRKPFSVTVGTLFERSHIPLSKWLMAVHLMSASKKGISSHQMHRMLGVTYKTAWFMTHRIRESMKPKSTPPMGGEGKFVEVDETFIGNTGRNFKGARCYWHKEKIVGLIDRSTGEARSFHVENVRAKDIRPIVEEHINKESTYTTDESSVHFFLGKTFKDHQTTNHGKKQYVRGEVHTNSIEGYFSIFKRGMKGVYQHCSKQHLQRYLHEFDFRYTHRDIEDSERADKALKNIEGRRLTYRRSTGQQEEIRP